LPEATTWEEHLPRRNIVGGLEQKLEQELRRSGWDVMNTVTGSFGLDEQLWRDILPAFAERFKIQDPPST